MSARVILPIVKHELRVLAHTSAMWYRFLLFYLVFTAAMAFDAHRGQWDRFAIELIGLMVLAGVGVATALAGESFAQEKERGTMEALLLVPTSARELVRAKLVYVCAATIGAVCVCLVTGAVVALSTGVASSLDHAINRSTLATAFFACPPATVAAGAIGTAVSCRARSLQAASAAGTIAGMVGMVVVVGVAYALSVSGLTVGILVTASAWTFAALAYNIARASASPRVMIRTRGR